MRIRENTSIQDLFLNSALTEENPFISTTGALEWIEERKSKVAVSIEKIKFAEMEKWRFDEQAGNIRHDTGKFFSIDGIHVSTNWRDIHDWFQPIINQPEVGYLGIITRVINNTLYFLMQAKIEPGNINKVQLSPTIQATKSNYTRAHKGKAQVYLDYFLDRQSNRVLIDQLQSEQGARFMKKRNRNIIIMSEIAHPHDENYIWLTLGQIKQLLQYDNMVNMDTRTVISGIPFGTRLIGENEHALVLRAIEGHDFASSMLRSMLETQHHFYSFDEILTWFTNIKLEYELEVTKVPLSDVVDWKITDDRIEHKEAKYFRVVPVKVQIEGREVQSWCQPMIEPLQSGLIAYIVKKIKGVHHLLIQAKVECGNFDVLEMAPTVQCLTGNYRDTRQGALPFLDYVLNAPKEQIRIDTFQSEEGGRFYEEQNRNLIIEVGDDFDVEVPENYIWLTLNQASTFLKFNNYLNVQARSLLSLISFKP